MDWMHYLRAGVISIFLLSCAKTDFKTKGEFYYINVTNQSVTLKNIDVYRPNNIEEYKIAPSDTLLLYKEGESSSNVPGPGGFIPPLNGDTVVYIFSDSNCLYEIGPRVQGNISNISSYSHQKVSDLAYKFYFKIDSVRFNQSVRCN
jgi:hypothetical protein